METVATFFRTQEVYDEIFLFETTAVLIAVYLGNATEELFATGLFFYQLNHYGSPSSSALNAFMTGCFYSPFASALASGFCY